MHLKVFVKLKKALKTLSSGQKNPKNPKKTKKPKKKQKTQKNPLGWVFLKKPGFFPTLVVSCFNLQKTLLFSAFNLQIHRQISHSSTLCNKWLLTLGSPVMILNASLTCWLVAPPPTSRKLAGAPPCSLMMSIVAMASPAPFTYRRNMIIRLEAVIRIGFNADPDPAYQVNAEPDPDPRFWWPKTGKNILLSGKNSSMNKYINN